jgi:hypothetical protein
LETGSDSSKDTVISEKEMLMIDKFAQWIVDSELEAPSLTILHMIRPLARIGGDLAYFYLGAFIPLLDNYGYDFLDTFEKKENVELLMKKVDRLSRARDKEKREKHGPSFFDKMKQVFRPKKIEGG